MNKSREIADLVIDHKGLQEIKARAAKCPIDHSKVTSDYKEAQFLLALWGLKDWIESYGIAAPFDIKLGVPDGREVKGT